MQEFIYDWTAEEDQHAMLLETYLLFGDNGDHRERARLRKLIIRQGWEPPVQDQLQAIAYTATQELATRAFYQRVAAVCKAEDPLLARALNRMAKDETLHYAFYKDAVKAHLEVEPNFVEPLARMLMEFEMPGADMPDYAMRDAILRREGVFSPSHFYSMVVDHLWREWDIPGLLPQAQEARDAQKRLVEWHASWGASPPATASTLRLERAATRGVTMASPRAPASRRVGRRQGSAPAEPRARPTPGPGGSGSPSRRPCPAR